MVYSSKAQLVNLLRNQLRESRIQVEKGIKRIYEYQTQSEQNSKDVKLNNGVGFTPADAYILSSFAEQLNKYKNYHLSEKQLKIAFKLMPKYAGQLIEQSIHKGLIKKSKEGYSFIKGESKVEQPTLWTKEDEKSWIGYKNEFAKLEAKQEQKAFEAKMKYEDWLNRG